MRFKDSVSLEPSTPLLFVLVSVDMAYKYMFDHEALMTSATDGFHMSTSLHYNALAWDFRTRQNNDPNAPFYPEEKLKKLRYFLETLLGDQFDVILEPSHIHVEYDPRTYARRI